MRAATRPGTSGWENGDLVFLAPGVSCDEREVFASCLCHQHPVEGIPVNEGETSGRDGVLGTNGQLGESAAADSLWQVRRPGELSGRLLDGHFPDGRGTDVNVRVVVEPG